MNQIPIIDSPLILTKNKEWFDGFQEEQNQEPGNVLLLPEDAVLVTGHPLLSQGTDGTIKVELPAKKRKGRPKGKGGGRKGVKFSGHECCGSKGPRHMSTCENNGKKKKLHYACMHCDHRMTGYDIPEVCEKCGKPDVVQKVTK